MLTLGIDIGSTTSKAVILRDGEQIVSSSLVVATVGTGGVNDAMNIAMTDAGVSQSEISCIVATGYGRATFQQADYQVSELTCHAKGVHHIFPEVRTVIDIGGQDAKVIQLDERGIMSQFLMNDKCAAGTGRFLDVMAGILHVDINEMGSLALTSEEHASISSTCTVFAESEVISQLAGGRAMNDIIAGICDSVAVRTASLAKRIGIKEKVCMSGGVARNAAVRKAMEKELGTEILFDEKAQLMGALGAAISAFEKIKR